MPEGWTRRRQGAGRGHAQSQRQGQRAETCEWMFADAGSGVLGFQEVAHLNPLRWSGALSLDQGISDLKEVQSKGNRSIRLKVPAGVLNRKELEFDFVQEA